MWQKVKSRPLSCAQKARSSPLFWRPKVNAKLDRSICKEMGLPNVPFEYVPPMLVADVGANPWRYGNQGILLNSDALKQALFGPIDGPPRNSAQIGMPG